MPVLSAYARKKKAAFFINGIPKDRRVLEIGCGDGWLGRYMRERGWAHYTGLDLRPPADIVGDIRQWRQLGMAPDSFDVVLAFEVVEHVDCFQEMYDVLRPGGLLMLTSPAPNMDWFCKLLEALGLTQRRTSPHDHLVDFGNIRRFEPVKIRRVGLAAQWGVFQKPETART